MPTSVSWNGSSYSIPQTGEFNWQSLTDFLVALGNNAQTVNFQKVAIRVATTSPVTVAAATDCIVVSNLSVAGPVAVTLPPGVDKQMFFIVDGKGDAATNNITITPDGSETINGAASYVINVNRGGIGIIYLSGQGWTVFGEFGNATGAASYISRSKIEAGTANEVIINDGSGFLSSEAQLASTRGGTGVSNSGTLTYGANNITLTTSGVTALTLPLSGTLVTRTGAETLEDKTLKTPLINGGSIDVDAAGNLNIGASVGANTITLGGVTSSTVIPGNLTIQGTTTTVDTQTLDVKDPNILLNDGGNDTTSEGAGITIDRTGTKGSIIYKDASASKFAVGALGAEADVVTTTASQTLTNKTLDASLTISASAVATPNGINFDSNTLVIDAANNRVGIGTATPTNKLDVVGDFGCNTANVNSIVGNVSSLGISPLGTSATTMNVANNVTISGEQKNISIGANGASGSETIVSIGSSVAGAINRFTFNGSQAVKLPVGNNTTDRPALPANGMIRYNSTENVYEGYSSAAGGWSAIGGGSSVDRINKVGHGFDVGDVLYFNGTTYLEAQANAASTSEVVGIVSRVIDADNFELTLSGEVTSIASPASLVAGTVYFLSDATPGLLTASEPSTVGSISLPLGVAISTTSLYFAPKRGMVVGGANARTQITLANNATTDVQNVSGYEAGELAGWVSLVNTTAANSLRFYVQAPFARYGGSANYFISPSYVGDTPPVGFSMTVTAGGVIQITMPNWSGYSSAVINYALNAPAVGTNFPLSLNLAQLVPDGTAFSTNGWNSGAVNVTMSSSSPSVQRISSPSSAVTVTLPTTSIKAGYQMKLIVSGATETNYVALQSSGANEVDRIGGDGVIEVVALQDTPTTAAHWLVTNVFETSSYSFRFTTGLGTSAVYAAATTVVASRSNKTSTFSTPGSQPFSTTGTGSVTAGFTAASGTIPLRYRPIQDFGGGVEIQLNGIYQLGWLYLLSSGGAVLYRVDESVYPTSVTLRLGGGTSLSYRT